MLKDVEPKLKLIVMMMGSIFTNATMYSHWETLNKKNSRKRPRAKNRAKIIWDDL